LPASCSLIAASPFRKAGAVGSALTAVGLVLGAALFVAQRLVPRALLSLLGRLLFRCGYNCYLTQRVGTLVHKCFVWGTSAGSSAPLRAAHTNILRPTRLYRSSGGGGGGDGAGAAAEVFASVWPCPLLNDNFCYLLVDHASGAAAAVDVCEAAPVLDMAASLGVRITAILTTHRHHDHSGGNLEMVRLLEAAAAAQEAAVAGLSEWDTAAAAAAATVQVFAGSGEVPGVTRVLRDGEVFSLGATLLRCVTTPTHTPDHVAFVVHGGGGAAAAATTAAAAAAGASGVGAAPCNPVAPNATPAPACADADAELPVPPTTPRAAKPLPLEDGVAAFTGDCLFVGGVGACFHGSNLEMVRSLAKLSPLPPAALVFPGHDYASELLWRQAWVEPESEALAARCHWAARRRARCMAALPVRMCEERATNAWVRVGEALAAAEAADEALVAGAAAADAGALAATAAAAARVCAQLECALDSRLAQAKTVPRWRRMLLGTVPAEFTAMRRRRGASPPSAHLGANGGEDGEMDVALDVDVDVAVGVDVAVALPPQSVTTADAERILEKLVAAHGLCGDVDIHAGSFGDVHADGPAVGGRFEGDEWVEHNGGGGTAAAAAVTAATWQSRVTELLVTNNWHYVNASPAGDDGFN
jgi:hydroxyacylglutathione hydrolase